MYVPVEKLGVNIFMVRLSDSSCVGVVYAGRSVVVVSGSSVEVEVVLTVVVLTVLVVVGASVVVLEVVVGGRVEVEVVVSGASVDVLEVVVG